MLDQTLPFDPIEASKAMAKRRAARERAWSAACRSKPATARQLSDQLARRLNTLDGHARRMKDDAKAALVWDFREARAPARGNADATFSLLYALDWCLAYGKPLSAFQGLVREHTTLTDAEKMKGANAKRRARDAAIWRRVASGAHRPVTGDKHANMLREYAKQIGATLEDAEIRIEAQRQTLAAAELMGVRV